MILIAESGSTKTTWRLLIKGKTRRLTCLTAGINPFFQSTDDILNTLEQEFTLDRKGIRQIYFYGAGCANPEKSGVVKAALMKYFGLEQIEVESDLLAAARALCGHSEGVVAILGTGSNSCYYDGHIIRQHVSPLGFILGDEGSGAVLGRKLVADLLKNQLPDYLQARFLEMFGQTSIEIMEKVYRQPFPNRYLASFTPFLSRYIKEEPVYELVKNSFIEFFRRNIKQYPRARYLPVHFTGSIAWHFADVLKEAASQSGFTTGKIIQDPIQGLAEYHQVF
ncbi:MAG: ATPase [Bacteroidales bacterium]|nr:ATPase [Bacteroidales bacterium]